MLGNVLVFLFLSSDKFEILLNVKKYSIADFTEPRDRIVQVVRWFLSAFHAGRRSEVAKKPYNPIIGETFRCWWDVSKDKTPTETLVSDGPVPWCDVNQLTFVAEQVSHHPPGIFNF